MTEDRGQKTDKVKFTTEELELLRSEAAAVRAWLTEHLLCPASTYEEDRLEFVESYVRGAEPATRKKQRDWLEKIKRECEKALKRGCAKERRQ